MDAFKTMPCHIIAVSGSELVRMLDGINHRQESQNVDAMVGLIVWTTGETDGGFFEGLLDQLRPNDQPNDNMEVRTRALRSRGDVIVLVSSNLSFDEVDGDNEVMIVDTCLIKNVKSECYLCFESGKSEVYCRPLKKDDQCFFIILNTFIGDNVKLTTFQTMSGEFLRVANDRSGEVCLEKMSLPVDYSSGSDARCFQMTNDDSELMFFQSTINLKYLMCDENRKLIVMPYEDEVKTEQKFQLTFVSRLSR